MTLPFSWLSPTPSNTASKWPGRRIQRRGTSVVISNTITTELTTTVRSRTYYAAARASGRRQPERWSAPIAVTVIPMPPEAAATSVGKGAQGDAATAQRPRMLCLDGDPEFGIYHGIPPTRSTALSWATPVPVRQPTRRLVLHPRLHLHDRRLPLAASSARIASRTATPTAAASAR
ncbi:MAG: hypothetical protein R2873_13310 [Caldilineaceae bacterium]